MKIYSIKGKRVDGGQPMPPRYVDRPRKVKDNSVQKSICFVVGLLATLAIIGVVVYLIALYVSWIVAVIIVSALVMYISDRLYDHYEYEEYE